MWKRRGISVTSYHDQSHYLHPHPYQRSDCSGLHCTQVLTLPPQQQQSIVNLSGVTAPASRSLASARPVSRMAAVPCQPAVSILNLVTRPGVT
jgi:hypothetical protein